MKKLPILVLFAFFVSSSYAQVRDTETMMREIFESIKTQDEKRFIGLFPSASEFKAILVKMMLDDPGSANLDSMQRGSVQQMLDEITDSTLAKEFVNEYRKAMRLREASSVDWSSANFVSFRGDTSSADNISNAKAFSGHIYFNTTYKQYFISFSDVIWWPDHNAWYGVNIRAIKESSGSENEIMGLLTDTSFGMIDTAITEIRLDEIKEDKGPPQPQVPQPLKKKKSKKPIRKED